MRFCFITTFYPPWHYGGDAVYVHRLANSLAGNGHEVTVIHCSDAFKVTGGKAGAGWHNHESVNVHSLSSSWGRLSPIYTHQTGLLGPKYKEVAGIVEEGCFDVIHYHNVSLVGGLEVLELGDAIKLYTLHEYWLVCPTHILFKNRNEACTQPECLKCQLVHRRPPQLWRSQDRIRQAIGHVDCILSASEFAVKLHQERGLNFPYEILPLMITLPEEETEKPMADNAKAPYFLFVGRLEKLKGLQDILPLFRERPDLVLHVAGSGEWETELRKQAGGCPNIRFLGHCTPGQLKTLYRNAIATLMPSLCYEISPLVIGESWSQGTPVIARRLGSMEEIIERAAGGCLFETVDDLRNIVMRLVAEHEWRSQLGSNGRQFYVREQTPETHLERYIDLIDSLRSQRQIESISP